MGTFIAVAGTVLWVAIALVVVFAAMRRYRRVPCEACGLSMDPREVECPYCGVTQGGSSMDGAA